MVSLAHPPDPAPPPSKWRERWRAFRGPIVEEKARVLKERWDSLPAELRTNNQTSARHLTHGGCTLGASYCSFHCTHCYLPKNANEIPIPSFEQVKEQIDANRRLQGPGGGLQITGGDVADAYWKAGRSDELIEIVRYAISVGSIPMLMTHGQTLIEQPEFLERLMVEGGLRQISVHVDMTQAGRHGYPIGRIKCEADLHPVRQAFTDLALRIRERTGCILEYALSFTVTRRNIDDVPEVIRWYLADPRRSYVWRMLSFQPEADTGRTLFSENPITPADVWDKICQGVGMPLRRDVSIFGHPDCNSWASLLIARPSGKIFPLLPDDKKFDSLLGEVLRKIGGFSLVNDDAGTPPYRLAGVLFKNPVLIARVAATMIRYLGSRNAPREIFQSLLRGKVHTLGVGMHNFMGSEKVVSAATDPVIRARLDSCVFKGAVKRNGSWEAVPMCAMNQQTWSEVYDERLQDPELKQQPQPAGTVA